MSMAKPPLFTVVRRPQPAKGGAGSRRRVIPMIAPPPAPEFQDFAQELCSQYRVADTSKDRYELFVGEDALPDFTAAADATSTSLPFAHSITPPGAGTKVINACVRKRNEYNVLGLNQYVTTHEIDTGGNLVVPDPSAATDVEAINHVGLKVVVKARYNYRDDGETYRGDTWRLYVRTDGTDPVPASDTPEVVQMRHNGAAERLHKVLGPYTAGAGFRVIVRVFRGSDGQDDGNVTVTSVAVPSAPSTPTNGDTFPDGS